MRQVIICQFALFPRRRFQHRVDLRQTGLWTIAHGNGHGTAMRNATLYFHYPCFEGLVSAAGGTSFALFAKGGIPDDV